MKKKYSCPHLPLYMVLIWINWCYCGIQSMFSLTCWMFRVCKRTEWNLDDLHEKQTTEEEPGLKRLVKNTFCFLFFYKRGQGVVPCQALKKNNHLICHKMGASSSSCSLCLVTPLSLGKIKSETKGICIHWHFGISMKTLLNWLNNYTMLIAQ